MAAGMEKILAALHEQHDELAALLDGASEADWDRPTRCEGWDVVDVVVHLAQTDELAVASARGEYAAGLTELAGGLDPQSTVDDGAAAMVARQRDMPHDEILTRWRTGAAALREALAANSPSKRVTWVAGQLATQTLAATRLSECWIHTGDVAGALGVEQAVTRRLEHIARLAWRTLPYAFARDGRQLSGPVEFDLRGPDGERWHFVPEAQGSDAPVTVIEGSGAELCSVAARRVDPHDTSLHGTGPDVAAVLELVRTYA